MSTASVARVFGLIWPAILGMACTRTGLIVTSYGAYESTDQGLFTDGANLVSLAVLFVFLCIIARRKSYLSNKTYDRLFYLSVALEFISVAVLTYDCYAHLGSYVRIAFCALCSLANFGCMAYWLYRMKGLGGTLSIPFAFGSLAISEVTIYIGDQLDLYGYIGAAVLVVLQPLCCAALNKTFKPSAETPPQEKLELISYAHSYLNNSRLLCITAVGIALLFFVDGMLRGYPSGASIHFTPETRICTVLLTLLLCAVIITVVHLWDARIVNLSMFVSLELLAALALLVYASFPDNLEMGAVFATTLNALLCAFLWHVVIAFMTFGWRDASYYAMGSWIACLGSRALARVLLVFAHFNVQEELVINACMFAILLISTQILLTGFYGTAKLSVTNVSSLEEQKNAEFAQLMGKIKALLDQGPEAEQNGKLLELCAQASKHVGCKNCTNCSTKAGKPSSHMVSRLMGLDKPARTETPQESMRKRAQAIGDQFLLSEREVEVLSLYALGWTQKRVGEELCIQPSTVHAHIKRIYSKTNLHSRQEILDYMEEYVA